MTLVFVHGGVSGTAKERPDIARCAAVGRDASSALDAVERAVADLEDHPGTNAGYGATLNADGLIELDAAIADGRSGRHGGVMTVTVRHPISLARRVMANTPHVLMSGAGAMRLADGMEVLEATTDEQIERYRAVADRGPTLDRFADPEHVDTVGAVALDAGGALAAGSSTGGVFGKLPGRVGDSAIPGAGTYASPVAAVVGTGVGEAFLETLACFRVARLIEEGEPAQSACEQVVRLIGERRDVAAGLLALAADGAVGAAYRGGSWAVAGVDGPLETVRVG